MITTLATSQTTTSPTASLEPPEKEELLQESTKVPSYCGDPTSYLSQYKARHLTCNKFPRCWKQRAGC